MPTAGELRLEQSHQRDLAMIGGGVISAVSNIALGADPAAISTWFFTAFDSIMARVSTGYAQSRRSGTEYLRTRATMAGSDVDVRAGSLSMSQARTSLEVTGPVAFKTAVAAGADDEEALLSMATQMSGSAQRLAIAGDRDVLEQTIAHGKGVVGYRRVLGGPGCGFCAMLASRGAVYLSRETASTSRSGLRFHDHCRCHVEPMFSHEPDPPDVQRLQRQWQRITAGQTGKDKAVKWRNYWENEITDRSKLRLAAAKAGPPSPIPGMPRPAPGVVVRSGLDAKRSLAGLQEAWAAEAKRITGRQLDVFIPTGASLQTSKEYAEGVLRGLERFPDVDLHTIRFYDNLPRDVYAQGGNGGIEFNARWASMRNRPDLVAGLQNNIAGWTQGRNGWSTRAAGNPMALSLHEFSHVLDIDNLGERIHSRALTLAQRRAALEGIAVDDLIARDISIYATSSAHELVAESFTDVMLRGQAASPLARDVFDLLEAEYFKAGGRITPAFGTFPAKAAPNLAKMTIPQLRALAAERGIKLPSRALKADIVRALEDAGPAPRIVKARPGSTIGDVELGPTVLQVALGEAPIVRVPAGDFVRRPYDGPDGVILARGEPLPAGFQSRLTAIRRGEFQLRPGLTVEESRALDRYALSRIADPLNTALRQGQTSGFGTARIVDQIVDLDTELLHLDSAIAAGRLARDTELYRGALMRPADIGRLQIGAITRESGFLSTTADQSHAFEIINWRKATAPPGRSQVIFKILAPKGTRAAAGHIDELEVLLGRNRSLRVVDILRPTQKGDIRVITLELLPDTLPAPIGAARWLGNVDLPAAEAERIGQLVQAKSRRDILDEIVQLRAEGATSRALANRIRGRAALPNTYDVAPQVDNAFRDELLVAVDNGTIDDVVRRHLAGLDGAVRRLDVEVLPVLAEKPLAKRTVAELRALAKERDITLPPRATKAQIVERLQAPPLTAAEKAAAERRALREAVRERNRQIEQATGTARLLAEVDELLVKKAEARVIRQRLDPKLIDAEQVFANADPAIREALAEALASGDMAKVRAAVTRLTTRAKIKVVGGKAGAKVKFDPATMESVGAEIADGAPVTVVTRGASVTLPDGTVVQVRKAQVTPVKPKVPPGPESLRAPGRDLEYKVTGDAGGWIQRAEDQHEFGEFQDRVLTALVRKQDGWSDPSRVVTKAQLDRAIGSGWTELWRGVRSEDFTPGAPTASRIAQATRIGDWDMGQGIYGNGVYTTVRRTAAEEYRDSVYHLSGLAPDPWGPAPLYEWLPGFEVADHGRGGLIRMALDPKAKIADYEELKAEHIAYLRSIGFNSLPESPYKRSLYDSSFYAAMRGYDGIRVHGPGHNDGSQYPTGIANQDEPPQYIIFNRSVLIFEKGSRRFDT